MKNKKKNPMGASWFKRSWERIIRDKTKYSKSERKRHKIMFTKQAMEEFAELPSEVIDEMIEMFESDDFLNHLIPIDIERLKEEEPEVFEILKKAIEEDDFINPNDMN